MTETLAERALKSATDTREIVMGTGVLCQTGSLFRRLFPDKKVIVVADENTFTIAGQTVVKSLATSGVEADPPYIFPGTPTLYASYDNVEILREHIRPLTETIVCSIASGTLNDIAKLASGELGRPYINVCTAASVDGYASFGASITRDGFKITRECPAPAGLIADLDIIASAPSRLTATGYGDLIEKIPAGADWILADKLGIEPINPDVWNLVQGPLYNALSQPSLAASGDTKAISGLIEGNIMSGLAMQAMKSSRPASGAGHQFSHVWEMEGHGQNWEPPLSHGFKVGVGTVASLALWEEALKIDMASLNIEEIVSRASTDEEVERRVNEMLSPEIAESAVIHSLSKNLQGDMLRDRVAAIVEQWPEIVARVQTQIVSPEEAALWLKKAQAPYHPHMIGIDTERFRRTHFQAQMIRSRYTVLDMLVDLGMLKTVVDHLFSPDGYWGRHSQPDS